MFGHTHTETELGEMIYLNLENVFRVVLAKNEPTRIAQEGSFRKAFSVDATALTEKTSHIFEGCKNVDLRSQDHY